MVMNGGCTSFGPTHEDESVLFRFHNHIPSVSILIPTGEGEHRRHAVRAKILYYDLCIYFLLN